MRNKSGHRSVPAEPGECVKRVKNAKELCSLALTFVAKVAAIAFSPASTLPSGRKHATCKVEEGCWCPLVATKVRTIGRVDGIILLTNLRAVIQCIRTARRAASLWHKPNR